MFIKYVFFTFLSFYVGYASSACSTIHEQGTTQADEDFIVNKHNELRLTIAKGTLAGQPRGINLKRLQYSKILGEKAQEIANSCELAHKPVNGTQWNWVANNLFIYHFGGFNKGADWNSAIQGWWDEHKNYKFGTPPAENTGHYTQLAWANTDHIGCGYTHFEDNDPKYKYHKLYVCNYAPGGNIAGQNPYQTGNSGCENLC